MGGGGRDRCAGKRKKAAKSYNKWKQARGILSSRQAEAKNLCGRADRFCDIGNFEGKVGEDLQEAIDRCRDAEGDCAVQEDRVFDAEITEGAAEMQSDSDQADLSNCEHKKKGGGGQK